MDREAEPGCIFHRREVNVAGDRGAQIRTEHAEEDRHDLDHAFAPDVADHDDDDCHNRDPPGIVEDRCAGGVEHRVARFIDSLGKDVVQG